MAKRIIAVDLDGTLAQYDGWKGIGHIGCVIPEVANAMERAQAEGAEVHLFTARVSDPEDAAEAHQVISKWAEANHFNFASITAVKHKFFTEFWDDRAIQVIKNEGIFVLNEHTDNVCLNDGDDFGLQKAPENNFAGLDPTFTPAEEVDPMDVQEGGDHYKKYPIQPIEFMHRNNIPSVPSQIMKYVIRYKDKNGLEDLRKAQHLLTMLMQMDYGVTK